MLGKGQPAAAAAAVSHHNCKNRSHQELKERPPAATYTGRPPADQEEFEFEGVVGLCDSAEVTGGGPREDEDPEAVPVPVVEHSNCNSGELRFRQRNVETVDNQLDRLQRQHNNGKKRVSLMSFSEASDRELIESHRKQMRQNRVQRDRHQAHLRFLRRESSRARLTEHGGPDSSRESQESIRNRAAQEYAEASIKTLDAALDAEHKYMRSLEEQVEEENQTEEKKGMRRVLKHLAMVQKRVEEQRVAPLTITPKSIAQAWDFPADLKPIEVVHANKPCPCCLRFFHCGDFVGASCGCLYHLHCAALWFKDAASRCCQCGNRMHPAWLTAWGKEWDLEAFRSNLQMGLDALRERWRKNVGSLVVPHKNAYRHVEPAPAAAHDPTEAAGAGLERSFSATLEPSVQDVPDDHQEPRREYSHVAGSSTAVSSGPQSPPLPVLRKRVRNLASSRRPQSPARVEKKQRPIEGVKEEGPDESDATERAGVVDGKGTGRPYYDSEGKGTRQVHMVQPLLAVHVKEEEKSSSVGQPPQGIRLD